MKIKLTVTQELALEKLACCRGAENAYGLQESLATLKSLVRLGLASRQNELGSFSMPRIGIKFLITGAGEDLAREIKERDDARRFAEQDQDAHQYDGVDFGEEK